MKHELITPREFLQRLEKKAEQLQEDISNINDYLLMAEKWENREEYRLLWTHLKAMEMLHCCMMNRIKFYKESDKNIKDYECYVDSEGYERCGHCNEHEKGMRYFIFCPRCGVRLKHGR